MNLQQTSKEFFKSLLIIYVAIILSQVLFGIVAYLIAANGIVKNPNTELNSVFKFIVLVLAFAGYIIGDRIFKNRMKSAKEKSELSEKMILYRSSQVMRYILLEGPSFFAIIIFLITGSIKNLIFSGLIIFIFLTMYPSGKNAIKDLELGPEEQEKINNPDAVIYEIR